MDERFCLASDAVAPIREEPVTRGLPTLRVAKARRISGLQHVSEAEIINQPRIQIPQDLAADSLPDRSTAKRQQSKARGEAALVGIELLEALL